MTIWDANVGELRAALERAGRRPLDDAHAMTLAVEMIDGAQEALEYFGDKGAHETEYDELERERDRLQNSLNKTKREAEKVAQADRTEIERLRKALETAEHDRDAARRDRAGSAPAFVAAAIRDRDEAVGALRKERERFAGLAREWADVLERAAFRLDAPRARKGDAVMLMRRRSQEMLRIAQGMEAQS